MRGDVVGRVTKRAFSLESQASVLFFFDELSLYVKSRCRLKRSRFHVGVNHCGCVFGPRPPAMDGCLGSAPPFFIMVDVLNGDTTEGGVQQPKKPRADGCYLATVFSQGNADEKYCVQQEFELSTETWCEHLAIGSWYCPSMSALFLHSLDPHPWLVTL